MDQQQIIIGLDTSNYTTSIAWVTLEGQVVGHQRQLLKVALGERGLRQSEALFQHLQNLPGLFEQGHASFGAGQIVAIAASTRPRPQMDSYMPVFKASEGYGRVMATALGVPFIATSHQEGHLMAGLYSAGGPTEGEFLAVHLSGGTSEILRVSRPANPRLPMDIQLLGGSVDLHAGQFIDRTGVAMGLPFPAGPHLEQVASSCANSGVLIPSSVQGYNISFSGPASHAQRLLAKKVELSEVARGVEHCIATSLEKVIRKGVEEQQIKSVLIVGGVAANRYLQHRLRQRLEHRAVGARLFFAEPALSSDNAVGVALTGARIMEANSN